MEKFMKTKECSPKFPNKENKCYTKDNIKEDKVWKSRNAAVCIVVQDKESVLMLKRGSDLLHAGKWCLPCGYIDYDENIYQAASRELYEEAGIFIHWEKFEEIGFYEVMSDPARDELQNITFHFRVFPEDIEVKIDHKEAVDHAWVSLLNIDEYEAAFNHKSRIENLLE